MEDKVIIGKKGKEKFTPNFAPYINILELHLPIKLVGYDNNYKPIFKKINQQTMSYHTKEIKKGVIGEFSKITEEYEELLDAYNQNDSVLQLCELSDLIGAIGLYSKEKWNISLDELVMFSEKTKLSFESGKRK